MPIIDGEIAGAVIMIFAVVAIIKLVISLMRND